MTQDCAGQTVLGNIKSQPKVLAGVLDGCADFLEPFVREFVDRGIRKVIFLGSGTSYNVAHIAAYYFKHLVGIAAEASYPTVFDHYEKPDWTGAIASASVLMVGISQSGTSVSTCQVMESARQHGCRTLCLTGDLRSEITRHVDITVPLLVNAELTPPETKGYTASVLTTYLWALACALAHGSLAPEKYDAMLFEAHSLVNDFGRVITESEHWYERNRASIVSSERIYVLGYGIDYGSMLEGMLKIGEMLRVPTIGYELEEFAHGPVMALRDNQTIFMIASDEPEFKRMLQFREAFKKYTPRVHAISCARLGNDSRDLVFSLSASVLLAPLCYTVPFQFVAAAGAQDLFIDTNINPFKESLGHYATKNRTEGEIQ